MTREYITTLLRLLISELEAMPEQDRVAILDRIDESFCRHCGREKPPKCKCENDE